MTWITAGLQALSILKGGAGSAPAQSASNGNFSNQFQQNGIAAWNVNMGGDGPPTAQAFRPDSFVLGLTGLDSSTGAASGNGIVATQPAAITNSILQNPWMWAGLAAVGIAFAVWGRK